MRKVYDYQSLIENMQKAKVYDPADAYDSEEREMLKVASATTYEEICDISINTLIEMLQNVEKAINLFTKSRLSTATENMVKAKSIRRKRLL